MELAVNIKALAGIAKELSVSVRIRKTVPDVR